MPSSEITSPSDWNDLISHLPMSHVLQSWEWGEFKCRHGWRAHRLAWTEGGATVAAASALVRRIPVRGFAARVSVVYVPKGPLLDWSNDGPRDRALDDLLAFARRQGAIFIKVDPDVVEPHPPPIPSRRSAAGEAGDQGAGQALAARGWRFSDEQVQFRNTLLVDLRPTEAELLAAMKPKTRYNIRLAQKKGVRVEMPEASEATLDLLYRMYAETAARDGFAIRPRAYYRDAWGSFIRAGLAQPLVAWVEGEPVSALVLFTFAGRAWYMYGMSRAAHRERMPNHLLQWEAMRWARARGCTVYDFWGAPDEFVESDPLWGVWKFKEGFGGRVVRHLGAWDYPLNRPLYWFYTRAMPRALDVMRRRARFTVDS